MSVQSENAPRAPGWGWPRALPASRPGFRAAYVARRVATAILVLWAAVTLSFLSIHLAPGDPVRLLMGEAESPALRALIETDLGLDRPLLVQYGAYLGRLAQGDLGYSYLQNAPINDILLDDRLVASAQLTAFAALLAMVLSVGVALLTAGRGGIVGALTHGIELVVASLPSFWLAILLISLFSFTLGWLPVTSGSTLAKLVLPGLTLALPLAAVLSQVIREGIERALEQPHAVTARARGIGPFRLRWAHALRAALLPATTLIGWSVGGMLTGTVIVEQVFGRTGIGQATVAAVRLQDIPVVLAAALLAALIYVVVNTLVDVLYLWIDPRLRTW